MALVISPVTSTLLAGSDVESEDYETASISVSLYTQADQKVCAPDDSAVIVRCTKIVDHPVQSCSHSNQSTEMFPKVQSENIYKMIIFVLSAGSLCNSTRQHAYRNLITVAAQQSSG